MEFRYFERYGCGFLKLKTCTKEYLDIYDLTDEKVRKQLNDIGFVVKKREVFNVSEK